MEKLAGVLTNYVLKKDAISKKQYEIYKYGFQTGLEVLICMVVSFIIAMQLHMVLEYMFFSAVFILLRSYAGGLHLDGFLACFCCSCLVQTGILVLAKYFQFAKIAALSIIMSMIILIVLIGPVNNINRPLDEKEQNHFRKVLKYVLVGIVLITVVLSVIGLDYYLSLMAITIIVNMVSMLIGKWKYKKDMINKEKMGATCDE